MTAVALKPQLLGSKAKSRWLPSSRYWGGLSATTYKPPLHALGRELRPAAGFHHPNCPQQNGMFERFTHMGIPVRMNIDSVER